MISVCGVPLNDDKPWWYDDKQHAKMSINHIFWVYIMVMMMIIMKWYVFCRASHKKDRQIDSIYSSSKSLASVDTSMYVVVSLPRNIMYVCIYIYIYIHPNGVVEFCPSNLLLKLLLDVCLYTQESRLKKSRLLFWIANLHIKLTHHANEDIQYKDLGNEMF